MNWIKSSKCDAGTCVEVATVGEGDNATIGVRNNRVPGEVVWFDQEEWRAFLAGVHNGDFDHLA